MAKHECVDVEHDDLGEHTYAGGMYDQSLELTCCIVNNDIAIVNVSIKVLSCGMMMFKQPLLYQTYFVQLVTMSVYCCCYCNRYPYKVHPPLHFILLDLN